MGEQFAGNAPKAPLAHATEANARMPGHPSTATTAAAAAPTTTSAHRKDARSGPASDTNRGRKTGSGHEKNAKGKDINDDNNSSSSPGNATGHNTARRSSARSSEANFVRECGSYMERY